MNKMIVAVVTLMLVASGTNSVLAQKEDGQRESREGHQRGMRGMGHRDPARMIKRMSSHLDLTELQQEKLNNIMLAAQPEFDEQRSRQKANREAMHALNVDDPDYSSQLGFLAAENGELVASATMLMGRIRADINNELTDEQREKMASGLERRRQRSSEQTPTE
jgi:Spy/CpxP family protein refolding chaperone